MVMYCTLLASAQSEIEKSGIKSKMASDPDLVRILKQLEGEGGDEEGEGGDATKAAKGGNAERSQMCEEVARFVKNKATRLALFVI